MRIGVLSSDIGLNLDIEKELTRFSSADLIGYYSETEQAIEYLNFEMPELAIVNFSDPAIDRGRLIEQVAADTWLHNFGIIGLFDKNTDQEKPLAESLKKLNILNIFERGRIQGYLAKTIDIIKDNLQVISQRDISGRFAGSRKA